MYRSPSSAEPAFLDPDELLAASVRAGLVEPARDQVVQPTTALRFAGRRVAVATDEEIASVLPLDRSVAARIANISGVWGAAIVSRTGETRGVANGPFARPAFVAFAVALATLRRGATTLSEGEKEPFAVRIGNRVAFAEAFASDVHLVVVDPSFDTRRAQQLLAELGAPPPPAAAVDVAATAGAFARPEAPLTGHWDAIPSDAPPEADGETEMPEPARPVVPTLGWLDRLVLGAPDPWLLLQRVILAARVRPQELANPPAPARQAQIVAHLERMSR